MDTVVLAPAGYVLDPDIGSDYERPWRLVEGLSKRGLRVVVVAREVRKLDELGANVELASPPGHTPTSPLGKLVDRVNLYVHARRVVSKEIGSGRVLAVHHLGPCGEQSPSLIGRIRVPFIYGPVPSVRPAAVPISHDEWLSWLLSSKTTVVQAWMSRIAATATRPVARSLWRRTMRRADVITVEASANAPSGIGEVVVIPPGIDIVRFSPGRVTERVPGRVIAVGRLIARKGYDGLIRAMRDMVDRQSSAHLLIVGTGPQERSLKDLVNRLAMGSRVTFTGDVPRATLPDLLKTAAVYCHPAVWDNVPFSLLEAMACGLAPVVSSAGGLPEMVGDAGLVYSVGDESELAGHLLQVLSAPKVSLALGAAARMRVVQYFTWQRMCDSYYDLYDRLANNRGLRM